MEGRAKKIKAISAAILVSISIASSVLAIDNLEIRELDTDFLDINELDNTKDTIYSSDKIKKIKQNTKIVDAPVLKGGITELKAIVGKSQIFRFDIPIKRFNITKPDLVELIFLSPTEIIVNGKQGGETTVIIWGEDGGEPVFFNLFVENNNLNFVKEVKKLAPNENISIDFVDSGTDSNMQVILKGQISSSIIKEKIQKVADAYKVKLVDLTETLIPQILLEVKIVEIQKNENKSRGVDFKQGLFDYLDFVESEGLAGTEAILKLGTDVYNEPWHRDIAWELIGNEPTSAIGPFSFDNFQNHLKGNSISDGNLNVWRAFPKGNLAWQLRAAEGEGIIKILAEPRIMVTHGERADFDSVQEVPIRSGFDALGNPTIDYKEAGIKVDITPTILEEMERIQLEITTEVSEISASASTANDVGFSTRKGTTKVEVANNQTTVISGLVRKTETTTTTKMPFLSNLPFIGKFFNTIDATKSDTEVMIFVTPKIIKPDIANEG